MAKKKIGLLGVSGFSGLAYVVQQILLECADHPLFEVAGFIADDPADVGKTLGSAIRDPWQADAPFPAEYANYVLLAPEDAVGIKAAGIELVISANPGPIARRTDLAVAAAGLPVISESAGLRAEADIPLIVPELNADHLSLVEGQKGARGTEGFVVAAPLCTAVIAAMVLKPLDAAFGLKSSVMTTMQALSGSGWNGVPSLAIVDNLLPFIGDEEEKIYAELPKILGAAGTPHASPIAATATRVAVRDGHTIAMTLTFDRAVTPAEVKAALEAFPGIDLPSAPARPLVVRDEPLRPQPLLDRVTDGGRVVTVGRIRTMPGTDNVIGLVAVGHNHRVGTWGNTLKLAELVATRLL